jgi:hypothetical protein
MVFRSCIEAVIVHEEAVSQYFLDEFRACTMLQAHRHGFKNSLNVAVTIAFASSGVRSCSREEAEDIAMCAATVNNAAICRSSARSILVSMVVRTALRAGAVSGFVSFGLAICFPSNFDGYGLSATSRCSRIRLNVVSADWES